MDVTSGTFDYFCNDAFHARVFLKSFLKIFPAQNENQRVSGRDWCGELSVVVFSETTSGKLWKWPVTGNLQIFARKLFVELLPWQRLLVAADFTPQAMETRSIEWLQLIKQNFIRKTWSFPNYLSHRNQYRMKISCGEIIWMNDAVDVRAAAICELVPMAPWLNLEQLMRYLSRWLKANN